MKPQYFRVFDVLVLAPAMFVAGSRLRKQGHRNLGDFFQAAALGTALYNGGNYAIRESYLGKGTR